VQRCVADIETRLGGVDILVNNAALATALKLTPFEKITVEEWTRVVTVNTLAPFLCSRAVAPGMRQRKWGRIAKWPSFRPPDSATAPTSGFESSWRLRL